MEKRHTSAEKARHIRTWLYAPGDRLHLHVTPGRETIIPAHLDNQFEVCLLIGFDLPIPIPDLVITETEVSGTLSFNGRPFFCRIKLDDVYAISSPLGARRMEFDVPQLRVAGRMGRAVASKPTTPKRPVGPFARRGSHLRLIKGGQE